jgi:hypothetical protein
MKIVYVCLLSVNVNDFDVVDENFVMTMTTVEVQVAKPLFASEDAKLACQYV